MKAKIVYLEPRGPGFFRSKLNSDTLWGALCWAIRMVGEDGNRDLQKLISSYSGSKADEAFYISSAFPYLYNDGSCKHHFLPRPKLPRGEVPKASAEHSTPQKKKELLRKHKQEEKRREWIHWNTLSAEFCGNEGVVAATDAVPKLETRPMAHSSIDRRRLGTFDTAQGGLLFHTNENYFTHQPAKDKTNWSVGLYFLVSGNNFSILEPALRFLEHFGIGGDRTTGKGNFRIDWADIEVPESNAPDAARYCLSLFRPTLDEIVELDNQADDPVFRYKPIDRQGMYQHEKEHLQPGHFYFEEGSVFPKKALKRAFPGENKKIRDASAEKHPVYRYGHALMLDIKIPGV